MKLLVSDVDLFKAVVFGGEDILLTVGKKLITSGATVRRSSVNRDQYYFIDEENQLIHNTCFITTDEIKAAKCKLF